VLYDGIIRVLHRIVLLQELIASLTHRLAVALQHLVNKCSKVLRLHTLARETIAVLHLLNDCYLPVKILIY